MKPILGARVGHLLAIIFFCFLPVYIKHIAGLTDIYDYSLELAMLSAGVFIFVLGAYAPDISLTGRRKRSIAKTYTSAYPDIHLAPLKTAIFALTVPAFYASIDFFRAYGGAGLYETGGVPPLSTASQVIFYSHLTLFFFACAVCPPDRIKEIIPLFIVVLLPRFIVTTSYGRWFVGQMLLPAAIFIIARLSATQSKKSMRVSLTAILAGISVVGLIFVMGAIRESSALSIDLLIAMIRGGGVIDVLKLHADNVIDSTHNYVIASSFFKTFPFLAPSDYIVTVWGRSDMVATLDRVITLSIYGSNPSEFFGTASNYVFEWYLSFGVVGVIVGSLIVGRIARYLDNAALNSSLGTFLFMELYPRIFLLPRSNFGYLIERVLWLCIIYAILVTILGSITRSRRIKNDSPK